GRHGRGGGRLSQRIYRRARPDEACRPGLAEEPLPRDTAGRGDAGSAAFRQARAAVARGTVGGLSLSCPGLSRAPTTCFFLGRNAGEGGVRPGHDGEHVRFARETLTKSASRRSNPAATACACRPWCE